MLNIGLVLPDVLGTYGDDGNALVLRQRLILQRPMPGTPGKAETAPWPQGWLPPLQGDTATAWQLQAAEPTGQKANSGRVNRKHDVLVLGKVGKVGLCWSEARLFSL